MPDVIVNESAPGLEMHLLGNDLSLRHKCDGQPLLLAFPHHVFPPPTLLSDASTPPCSLN